MKKSLNRRITAYFLIIMVLTVIVSVAWNYHSTRQSILDMERGQAEGCTKAVSKLLAHHEVAWEENTASEEYIFLQKAIRNFCGAFDQKAIYIYTIESQSGSHQMLMVSKSDGESDAFPLGDADTFPLQEPQLRKAEESLVSEDAELQRVVRDSEKKSIMWVDLYSEPGAPDPVFIAMEYDVDLENDHIIKDFLADILLPIVALGIAFLVLNLMIRRRVSTPIRLISNRMNRFAENSSELPEPLNIHCKDEIGEIASSFESMTEEITANIRNIEKLTKEREQTNVQLDVARRIQSGFVPEKTTMNDSAFCISAITRPAKAVGGDFYDCFKKDDGNVCILMGDVSGKGITGAIFMAMLKATLREKLALGLSPAKALNLTNQQLIAQNPEGLFATVFAAILNPNTGDLLYANAGHTYPVLLGSDPALLEPDSGIALGLFDDVEIIDNTMHLEPGQGLLLYTDGLTDALNAQRKPFGTKRLVETLKDISVKTKQMSEAPKDICTDSDPSENLLQKLLDTIDTYSEGVEPFDDTAVLILFRTEAQDEDDALTLPVSLSSFAEIKEAVFAETGNTPAARKALLACDETLTNIVRYSGATELSFKCKKQGETLCVVFTDNGIAFDPATSETEKKAFEELDSGGMGLNLIRQTASRSRYERRGEKNIFALDFSI